MTLKILLCIVVPLWSVSGFSAQQSRPLPDAETFMREARKRLQTDDQRQEGYSYVETRRQTKLDKNGNPKGESVKVFESYPGLPGEDRRWERLISEDGKLLTAAELEQQDRKRRAQAESFARRLAKETDGDRAKAVRERVKELRERDAMLDDAFRTFDMKMLSREIVDGHETVLVSFVPGKKVAAKTRIGGYMKHFRGRAWVSEDDYELVKLEAEALDNLSMGFGLLARLHKGSTMTFQRRKVDGNVWLPMKATYTASARIMLLRRMRVGGVSEFTNYRRFNVETSETYDADRR
jgi:hypothetical protein